jgi:hypothetical protein
MQGAKSHKSIAVMMNEENSPPPLPLAVEASPESKPPLRKPWTRYLILFFVLTGGAMCVSVAYLLNVIVECRHEIPREPLEQVRNEQVHAVSIYRFDGASGTSVGSNNYRHFPLAHVTTLFVSREIQDFVTPIRASLPQLWNHWGAGTPMLMVFETQSGTRELFGEVVPQDPNDLWIATDDGIGGVMAIGLGEWLHKSGILAKLSSR